MPVFQLTKRDKTPKPNLGNSGNMLPIEAFRLLENISTTLRASIRNGQATKRLLGGTQSKVDVVLVFHYDRLARSTIELITRVEEFRRLGVDFISYQQNVDTTTDIGKLYFTIMAGLAEYESSQIGRRVKAGMVRAKAQGKSISRPPLPEHTQRLIKELGRQDISIRKIAAQVGVSKATVQKYLA